jgi:hypothetical protein
MKTTNFVLAVGLMVTLVLLVGVSQVLLIHD